MDIKGFKDHRWLSNFASVTIHLDGQEYPSVEHAYQAAKTVSNNERRMIRKAATPGRAKMYGRKLVHLRVDWNDVRVEIMRDLLQQKFAQQPFHDLLRNTGTAYIEETNTWGDVFWGVCNGKGENNLGKLLMEIRSGL